MGELWKKVARKIEDKNKLTHIVEKIQENKKNKEQAVTNANDSGFNYIIKRPTFAPICFGSKVQRDPNPISGPGLSSFMARSVLEQFPTLAPNIYKVKGQDCLHDILNKKRSTKGLIGEEPRFREIYKNIAPPSSKYNLRVFPRKIIKRNVIPFRQTAVRFIIPEPKHNPGPGTYTSSKKRKIPFSHTFGGSSKLKPSIPIECVPVNLHVCEMCHLTPLIDFWHKNYTNFMCIQCYSEEFEEHNKYTSKQLREFKKEDILHSVALMQGLIEILQEMRKEPIEYWIKEAAPDPTQLFSKDIKLMRDCSFMHDHQGTDTYITTLPTNYLKKKLLIETYLTQYFDEFLPQPVHDLPVQLINVSTPDTVNFKDTTEFYTQFKQYLMRLAARKASKRRALLNNNDDSLNNK